MKTHLFRTLNRHSLRAVNGGSTRRNNECGDFRCIGPDDLTLCARHNPEVCGCVMDGWCGE